MTITTSFRFTAKQLMTAAAIARTIIKKILKGEVLNTEEVGKLISPEFTAESIVDALEYTYRLFSMFAWLTLGGNSLDDPFVLQGLSSNLKKAEKDDERRSPEKG